MLGSYTWFFNLSVAIENPGFRTSMVSLQRSLLLRCVLPPLPDLAFGSLTAGLAPGVPSTSFRLLSEVCLSVHAHGLD